jgi:hypothetical protein
MAGTAGLRAFALLLLAGTMTAAPGCASVGDPPAGPPQSRTGLTCAWTMLRTSAAVGRRCRVTPNPGLQATLEHSASRLEDHVRQTAPTFLRQMEEHRRRIDGQSDAQLCTAEAISFYAEMGNGEPEALRDETDRVIGLPGPPEWGPCR